MAVKVGIVPSAVIAERGSLRASDYADYLTETIGAEEEEATPPPPPPAKPKHRGAAASRKGAALGRHPCLGCANLVPASKTLCASCAEDMGYPRRAR